MEIKEKEAEQRKNELLNRKQDIQENITRRENLNLVVSILLLVFWAFLFGYTILTFKVDIGDYTYESLLVSISGRIIPLIALLVLNIIIILILRKPSYHLENQIKEISNEVELQEIDTSSIELRAEKLFKNHQFELKRYYDQTLRHSSWVFLTGIGCIIIGILFAAVTFYFVLGGKASENQLTAMVGISSALFSNFIGVVYLRMYSQTAKALTEFHNRLVGTHNLHFSNFLSAKITEKNLREKTLSEISLKLASNQYETSSP